MDKYDDIIKKINDIQRRLDHVSQVIDLSLKKDGDENYIWASETWSKTDLINALQYRLIEPTEENVEKLHQACVGMFDDKTERMEYIDEKVLDLFVAD